MIQDASVKVFDYEVIKASGWAYSKILKTTVLYEGPNSAVVQVDFNRHKADDSLLSTSKVFYTLAMTVAGWKLVECFNSRRDHVGLVAPSSGQNSEHTRASLE